MDLLNIGEPEYIAQAKAVFSFLNGALIKPMVEISMQHTVLFIPTAIITILMLPVIIVGLGWMIHPVVGLFAIYLLWGSFKTTQEKHELKKSGKWTAQDETNDLLNEMDWNQLIMNRQILDTLQVIAENSKKK